MNRNFENINEKNFRWIDTSIPLNFPLPTTLKNTMKEAEQADIEGDIIEYNILSDTLDVLCKNYCAERKMTKTQWDTVCHRFPIAKW